MAVGGYEAADARPARYRRSYDALASCGRGAEKHCNRRETRPSRFFQALAAFDFTRGDVLLTTRNDYIRTSSRTSRSSAAAGVRIVRAGTCRRAAWTRESVRALIRRERPKVVTLTWVPTNSGLVQPAEAVGAVCDGKGCRTS